MSEENNNDKGMNVQVNFDSDDVKKQLVQSIMDSAIGEEIKKSIEDALDEKDRSFSFNPSNIVKRAISEVLKQEVRSIAVKMIREKEDKIREQIEEKMTDDAVEKLVDKLFKKSYDL